MADKISPIKVIKEAVRLYRTHLKASLIYGVLPLGAMLVLVAINVPVFVYSDLPGAISVGFWILCVLAFMAGMLLYCVSFLNYGITALRGAPRIMPDNPVWRSLVFLGCGVIMYLIMFGVMFVLMFPLTLLGLLSPESASGGSSVLSAVLPLVASVAMGVIVYRLYLQFPAIAVGDTTSIKIAWRLSGGHSWRMFWSHFLLFLPMLVLELVLYVPLVLFIGSPGTMIVLAWSAYALIMLFSTLVIGPLMLYVTAIWYEGLRSRDKALRGAATGDTPPAATPEA